MKQYKVAESLPKGSYVTYDTGGTVVVNVPEETGVIFKLEPISQDTTEGHFVERNDYYLTGNPMRIVLTKEGLDKLNALYQRVVELEKGKE